MLSLFWEDFSISHIDLHYRRARLVSASFERAWCRFSFWKGDLNCIFSREINLQLSHKHLSRSQSVSFSPDLTSGKKTSSWCSGTEWSSSWGDLDWKEKSFSPVFEICSFLIIMIDFIKFNIKIQFWFDWISFFTNGFRRRYWSIFPHFDLIIFYLNQMTKFIFNQKWEFD